MDCFHDNKFGRGWEENEDFDQLEVSFPKNLRLTLTLNQLLACIYSQNCTYAYQLGTPIHTEMSESDH